jgi:hypothetical protein
MSVLRLFALSIGFIVAAVILPAFAGTTYSGDVLVPPPPGTVLQDQVFHPYGPGMMSRWHAVLSRKALGSEAGTTYYQWYLSLYAMGNTHFVLKYQSPSGGGPFDQVTKPVQDDAHMWFPVQDAKIVGIVASMDPEIEQLVVQSHQMSADCGAAEVDVYGYDQKKSTVVPVIAVANGCDLTAKIVGGEGDAPDSIALTGPYYKDSTPMCCPVKNNVTATLTYHLGQWVESPPYFKLYRGSFPK